MSDDDFCDGDWVTCWQCGGETTIASCFEEYACMDPEKGCDLCTRRCDICRGKGGWRYITPAQRTDKNENRT